jgi:acetyl-CoA carboxylase carboxyltransferase component
MHISVEWNERIEKTREEYVRWLDAKYAAARGHVDAIIDPLITRRVLGMALDVTAGRAQPEHLAVEVLH